MTDGDAATPNPQAVGVPPIVRETPPRRVANGIKLRAPDAVLGEHASRWRQLIESIADEPARQEGRAYARAGQIATLELGAGEVRATVQGRAARPYETVLTLPRFDADQWDRLIALLAAEAGHAARLLAGEVPAGLGDRLTEAGLELLPAASLTARCSCGGTAACKHAVALGHVVGERLHDEPLLVFTLRGLPGPRLLERLRQTRTVQTAGYAAAHADPAIPETQVPPPPLERCLDGFWQAGPRSGDEGPEHAYPPHALLRRLGPSPLTGRFPMVGLLASIYDTVSETAGSLRDLDADPEPTLDADANGDDETTEND